MKPESVKSVICCLSIAAVMTVGSQSSYGQKFSFGGKSFGGKSSSRSTQGGSKSSGFGRITNQVRQFGSSSSIGKKSVPAMTTKPWRGRVEGINKGMPKVETGKTITREIKKQFTDHVRGNGHQTGKPTLGLPHGKKDASGKLGNFLGHVDKIHQHIQHNQRLNKVCVNQHSWCHSRPKHCHWWYDWCKPIRYCEPAHQVHCRWDYVNCDYVHGGHVVVADARWYLGMQGLLLPGRGIGIEEVSPGSPAAQVGLQPGMVITRCNGIDLIDESALSEVIRQSHGVLRMELLLSENGPPATCVVVMQRVSSRAY